jgi:hypothetical protein
MKCSLAFGQIQQGAIFTGSSFSYYHALKPSKITSFTIAPNVGIMSTDNLGVLGEIFFDRYKNENYDDYSFGGHLSLRFYPVSGEQAAFLFYKTGGSWTKNSFYDRGYETYDFIPGLGLDIFLNENVAIEGQAGYKFGVNNAGGTKNKTQDIYITIGMQVFFHLE